MSVGIQWNLEYNLEKTGEAIAVDALVTSKTEQNTSEALYGLPLCTEGIAKKILNDSHIHCCQVGFELAKMHQLGQKGLSKSTNKPKHTVTG